MDVTAFIVGYSAFAFILLYIVFNLDKVHVYLKIFTVLFIAVTLALIPKVLIDEQDYCSFVNVNSTTIGNTTTLGYDHICEENTHNSNALFFRTWSIYVILLMMYMFIYLMWYLLKKYVQKLPTEVQGWIRKRQGKP